MKAPAEPIKIAVLASWGDLAGQLGRQLPSYARPEFAGIEFQFDVTDGADLVVFLNGPASDLKVAFPPERIWALILEPPAPNFRYLHDGQAGFGRIYTTDPGYNDARHIHAICALGWMVNKSYDDLAAAPYPAKVRDLSWITSNKKYLAGHRRRLRFLRRLDVSGLPFTLYGHGFTPIEDKWDALAPFRYSIAFENHSNELYFSEKLTDCFLAYTTPFYFGASAIDRYFPKGSYIAIDPDDPHVFLKMREAMEAGFHESHLAALDEARELCLNKYNTLAIIANEARTYAGDGGAGFTGATALKNITPKAPLHLQWRRNLRQRWRNRRKGSP